MVLDRKALESMRRSELQKLCKDYGVKANLKSDALIDLLIETSKPNTSPRTRSVSRRSTRNSSARISSVIVHDVEEEGDGENQDAEEAHLPEPEPTSQRTRKAKETQKRLGVGRPVAAGGTGARAVTRSANYSKGRKSRTSKSIKPTEETIVEEETENSPPNGSHALSASPPPPSPKDQVLVQQEQARNDITQIDQRIADALQPLLEQVQSLKAELEKVQGLKTELASVKSQVADVGTLQQKVTALTTEVEDLKSVVGSSTAKDTEIQQLKEQVSTLTDRRLALGSPIPSSSTERPSTPSHPGFAPSMLGKRQRDSTASNITGLMEEDHQDDLTESELAKRIIRPSKKRLRIDQEQQPSSSNQVDDGVRTPPRVYGTFSGQLLDTIVDEPPPTTPLPDFYRAATSPTPRQVTNQNATENRPYLVIPPTPGPGMFAAANFSYPEPPPSPTPAATSRYGYIDNPNRTDIFKAFAMPPPTRISPPPVSSHGGFVDPAALTHSPSDEVLVNAVSDEPKRTMYGTELDSESRFGDFGVGSQFWGNDRL